MWWKSTSNSSVIGLIAGQGDFPLLFAQAASSLKKKIILIGFHGVTDKKTEAFVSESHYLELGAIHDLFELIKKLGIREIALAGGIPKKEIYNPNFKMDSIAKDIMNTKANKGDDHLLRAFQVFLKTKSGASILDGRVFLKEAMAQKGVMTHRKPTNEEMRDLKFGWRIAKGIGRMDIGQTVVVKQGVVLAVEALEGTDVAIRRGGALCQSDAIVVKTAKPNQNLRFDLPCIGFETLESLKTAKCRVMGIESGKTIMLFREKLLEMANKENISLVGL